MAFWNKSNALARCRFHHFKSVYDGFRRQNSGDVDAINHECESCADNNGVNGLVVVGSSYCILIGALALAFERKLT